MSNGWFVDDADPDEGDMQVTEYDITSSPNDFNVKTLFDFIESDVVKIPPFQRNFVWDLKRSSKLIESVIMGLPIPQIFLYEKSRNEFLIIDGQQRLLSLYYFVKQRFPKINKRPALRQLLATTAATPDKYLANDEYFSHFRLSLPADPGTSANPLQGLAYGTLDDYKTSFDLRTIRVVIVKQNSPTGSSSVFEIFNRLNSGGVNLTPQEIRMSLYHSAFMDVLNKRNLDLRWRRLIGQTDPDLHFKDVEFLLRGIALLMEGNNYSPSMTKFLNGFALKAELFTSETVEYLDRLIDSFLEACKNLTSSAFHGQTAKFTISIFDAVFAAACMPALKCKAAISTPFTMDALDSVKNDKAFSDASQARTTGTGHVKTRIERALAILGAHS